jgi:hypothetical protein
MTASDRADALTALLTALRKKYSPEPLPERSAIEELIHATLLWESTSARADRAYKRLIDGFVDLNELRVSRPDEVVELLGKTYPLADERSRRLLDSLNAIYQIEHAVSLDAAAAAGKRDARKYLEAIESLPPFVVARVVVFRFDGHAVPLDQRTLGALIAAGVFEEGTDLERAVGQAERMIKATEAQEVALLLQAWTDDGLPALGKPSRSKTTRTKPASSTDAKPAARSTSRKSASAAASSGSAGTTTKKAASRAKPASASAGGTTKKTTRKSASK